MNSTQSENYITLQRLTISFKIPWLFMFSLTCTTLSTLGHVSRTYIKILILPWGWALSVFELCKQSCCVITYHVFHVVSFCHECACRTHFPKAMHRQSNIELCISKSLLSSLKSPRSLESMPQALVISNIYHNRDRDLLKFCYIKISFKNKQTSCVNSQSQIYGVLLDPYLYPCQTLLQLSWKLFLKLTS